MTTTPTDPAGPGTLVPEVEGTPPVAPERERE